MDFTVLYSSLLYSTKFVHLYSTLLYFHSQTKFYNTPLLNLSEGIILLSHEIDNATHLPNHLCVRGAGAGTCTSTNFAGSGNAMTGATEITEEGTSPDKLQCDKTEVPASLQVSFLR